MIDWLKKSPLGFVWKEIYKKHFTARTHTKTKKTSGSPNDHKASPTLANKHES